MKYILYDLNILKIKRQVIKLRNSKEIDGVKNVGPFISSEVLRTQGEFSPLSQPSRALRSSDMALSITDPVVSLRRSFEYIILLCSMVFLLDS